MNSALFSTPKPTKEQAQALHKPEGLFSPAAVFQTPDDEFVMARLRVGQDWPLQEIAEVIKDLMGYEMVSCCDPLLNVWQPYQAPEQGATP